MKLFLWAIYVHNRIETPPKWTNFILIRFFVQSGFFYDAVESVKVRGGLANQIFATRW